MRLHAIVLWLLGGICGLSSAAIWAAAPSVTVQRISEFYSSTLPISFTVQFSEAVTDFSEADLSLSAGSATLSGSGASYTVTVDSLQGHRTVTLSIPADVTINANSEANTASNSTDENTVYYYRFSDVVINEVDYDQVSTDNAEFIELYNKSDSSISLENYILELISGADNDLYQTINLTGNIAAHGYYVICGNSTIVKNCDLDIIGNTNLIQNATKDPDSIRLIYSGNIIDAVIYEGTLAGYGEGKGAPADSNSVGHEQESLSRISDGSDSNNNSADFAIRCATAGKANSTYLSNCQPQIEFTQASFSTPEAATISQIVTLTRSGFLDNESTVTINLESTGTASNEQDYQDDFPKIITFASNESSQSVSISLLDDTLYETDTAETLNFSLTPLTNAGLGSQAATTLQLIDNESLPSVSLEMSASSFAEAGGMVNLTARLSHASVQAVTVGLNFSGSATVGTDYSVADHMVIAAGSLTQQITLTAHAVDADQTLIIAIDNADNAIFTDSQSISATIVDTPSTPNTPNTPTPSPTRYQLSISSSGEGHGDIEGFSSGRYDSGTRIVLTAVAAEDSQFIGWTPASCGEPFYLWSNTHCVAEFTLQTWQLDVITAGDGHGEISHNSGIYPANTIIKLTATPDSNSIFSHWIPTECTQPILLNADTVCEAWFSILPTLPTVPVTTEVTPDRDTLNTEETTQPAQPVSIETELTDAPTEEAEETETLPELPNAVTPAPVDETSTEPVPVVHQAASTCPLWLNDFYGTCNAQGAELRMQRVMAQGVVSTGVISHQINNAGWLIDMQLTETGIIKGGKLSGTVDNQGIIRDVTFYGDTLSGGRLGGLIENVSTVNALIQNVQFEAGSMLTGGRLAGEIIGDPVQPVLLHDVHILAGSHLTQVILGKNIVLDASVQFGAGVRHWYDFPCYGNGLSLLTENQTEACFAKWFERIRITPASIHRGQAAELVWLALTELDETYYSFTDERWQAIPPRLEAILTADFLPHLPLTIELTPPDLSLFSVVFLGYRLLNNDEVIYWQVK